MKSSNMLKESDKSRSLMSNATVSPLLPPHFQMWQCHCMTKWRNRVVAYGYKILTTPIEFDSNSPPLPSPIQTVTMHIAVLFLHFGKPDGLGQQFDKHFAGVHIKGYGEGQYQNYLKHTNWRTANK